MSPAKKITEKDLQTGDILHCFSNRLIPRMIRKATKGRFNHTAIVVECWGNIYIVDSKNDGTNARPFKAWMDAFNYDFAVTRPQNINVKQFSVKAFSKIGATKYDFKSLLWYQPIYLLTGKWKGKKGANASKRMYCSEYVSWVFNLPNWWALSPQDLFDKVDMDPQFKTVFDLKN